MWQAQRDDININNAFTRQKTKTWQKYFGNLSGVFFSVCPPKRINKRCLWGVRLRSCQRKVRDLLSLSCFEVSGEATSSHTDSILGLKALHLKILALIQAQLCQPIYQHWELLQHHWLLVWLSTNMFKGPVWIFTFCWQCQLRVNSTNVDWFKMHGVSLNEATWWAFIQHISYRVSIWCMLFSFNNTTYFLWE